MYVIIAERTANSIVTSNTRYNNLKSLSFNPETDITLFSIPVCEFTVEIITTDTIHTGQNIYLYDEKGMLYAQYDIVKSEKISEDVVRILAQSTLHWMDNWTLKACRVEMNVSLQNWLYRFMTYSGHVKRGKQRNIYIDYQDGIGDIILDGFFPEQTMRERLQQICFAYGITVQQWFCTGLTLRRFTGLGQIPPSGSLIPVSDTFFRPEWQHVEAAGSFAVHSYTQWTVVKPEPMGQFDKEVTDDVNNTTWYCSIRDGYEVPNEDNDEGEPVEISDVMIINGNNVLDVYERKWRSFISEEYTVDVINNGQYYPNMPVRFYFDTDGNLSNAIIIDGIITKCDFTFGTQNRAKLTIARIPDTTPQTVHCTTVHYVYEYTVDDGEGGTTEKTLALGRNEYYVPLGTLVDFDLPTIYIDVVGDTLAFVVDGDDTRNVYGYIAGDHDAEYTLYYKRKEAS